MEHISNWFTASARLRLGGAPDGHAAAVLAATARALGNVIYVARDDARLEVMRQTLGFFAADLEPFAFPAWDCLPYDRVSPNGEIVSRRVDTLSRLAELDPDGGGRAGPRVLLTTVNALLQRVPPRAFFKGTAMTLTAGREVPVDALTAYLERNGYTRSGTVREAGEYAVRGSIIDLYPAGAEAPLRLDFFGDELETIRTFDAVTQRTVDRITETLLRPVGEFLLDDASIQRFRGGYRNRFGAETSDDPLYAAVSAGRRHAGMEHWLPLYHERLEMLPDYLGEAVLLLDHEAEAAATARLEMIAEYHQTRRSMQRSAGADGAPYKPLPPDLLYLSAEQWGELLARHRVAELSPFRVDTEIGGGTVVDCGGRPGIAFAEARARSDVNLYDAVLAEIARQEGQGRRVVVAGVTDGSRDRIAHLLTEHGAPAVEPVAGLADAEALPAGTLAAATLSIDQGYATPDLLVIAEQDILGERMARPSRRRRKRGEEFLREASSLEQGDFVVHVEHGIGQYDGLVTLEIGGAPHDCLRVIYSGGDKLFVPVESIDVLSRYGSEDAGAVLDKLGGAAWQARKARVKKRLRDMADQLIRIAAEREVRHTESLEPPAGVYDEFCARFPYTETDDQLRAIEDTLGDLSRGKPMDRLICGDVGFGKTEVALRAALVAAMQGYQVAVVVPTTLLCRQHFAVFAERFKGMPLKVRQLSRLVTAKEATEIRRDLASGEVNIVVGTHALLGKSVAFDNLGLLIVDEEQHFGVGQKERLKDLRAEVNVLTLTATPIPRTLQLALTGVREMSLIATPPVDRLSVRTFVMPFDGMIVREALMREHNRGGQSFYVCPRIEDMPRLHDRLTKLVPELRLASAHGRLSGAELEDVMTRFCDGGFDVLLSTNIVESGLDIPNANTIVIHRADMFGLAQLYQLRGRVGRSKVRAYAYLTTHPSKTLTPAAKRRLDVMQTLDSLGAGFSLASHDMDIRGAGNLLGDEQSGHVKEVGIELYQELLHEAVMRAKEQGLEGEPAEAEERWTPQIALGTPVMIPDAYVPDLTVRLSLYRRVAALADAVEIDGFAAELADRFGKVPEAVENLLKVIAVKQLCRRANVDKVDAGPKGAVISFRGNRFTNPAGLVQFIAKQGGAVQLRPDHKLVYRRAWAKPVDRVRGLTRLMQSLATLTG